MNDGATWRAEGSCPLVFSLIMAQDELTRIPFTEKGARAPRLDPCRFVGPHRHRPSRPFQNRKGQSRQPDIGSPLPDCRGTRKSDCLQRSGCTTRYTCQATGGPRSLGSGAPGGSRGTWAAVAACVAGNSTMLGVRLRTAGKQGARRPHFFFRLIRFLRYSLSHFVRLTSVVQKAEFWRTMIWPLRKT